VRIAQVRAVAARVTPRTTWVFARVTCTDGITGWGEGTLEGRADEVARAIENAPNQLPNDLIGAAAFSAIEQARWDLKARRAGRPLAELLGGARRERVPLYANINRGTTHRTPAGFAQRAREAAALGFGAIKIAPFDNMQEGYARIAAAADALAGRAELYVDCHWRFDERKAHEALAECARLGVTWFECPIPETPENFPAIKRLRAKANAAGMRLAGAELYIGVQGFKPLLEQGLYDVVMPDVKYAGGLAECLRIAELAAHHRCALSLHNPSGPVCHAQSVHLSAALASSERLEYQYAETPLFFAIAPGLEAPSDGSAALPKAFDIRIPEEVS
jgi:galactonate dehydratase